MHLRSALQKYGDLALAAVLALSMTLELVAWAEDGLAAAIAIGLLATVPLALRRRTPLISFLMVMTGVQLLVRSQPGFDNDSMAFVVTFFVALYSLGRHAAGSRHGWVPAVSS